MIAYAALIDNAEDRSRFTKLVEQYQEEMFRIARRVLRDHQLAEDAVQNAFYGVAVSFNKIPSDNPDGLQTYLLNCAKYAALHIKKTEQKIRTTELTDLTVFTQEGDPTFVEIEQSEAFDRLLASIRQLDEKYRDALMHFYVYNQSIREIAKLFSEKPSTIRQRLSRGRKLLAELCRKEGILHD